MYNSEDMNHMYSYLAVLLNLEFWSLKSFRSIVK